VERDGYVRLQQEKLKERCQGTIRFIYAAVGERAEQGSREFVCCFILITDT
jgi:hypothetical protein